MFQKVFFEVANKLLKEKKISFSERLRLGLRMNFASFADMVEAEATAEVLARGLATPNAIDWDKVREFLEWFIPFLIGLIGQ
jgi:hypothetical protein